MARKHVVAHNRINTAANVVTAANTRRLVAQNATMTAQNAAMLAQNAAHLEIELRRNQEAFNAVVRPTVSPAEVAALDSELRVRRSMVATVNMAYHLGYNPYAVWAWMNVRQPRWVARVRAALDQRVRAVSGPFESGLAAVEHDYAVDSETAARADRQGMAIGAVSVAAGLVCLVLAGASGLNAGPVFGLGFVACVALAVYGFRRGRRMQAAAEARYRRAFASVKSQYDAAVAPFIEPKPVFGTVTAEGAKALMWTFLRSATTVTTLR